MLDLKFLTVILLLSCLQIGGLITRLKETLLTKEQEMSAFKEKHNIHVRGEKESTSSEDAKSDEKSAGVLVAQSTSQ